MTDAVKGVDPEANTDDNAVETSKFGYGGQTHHVFGGPCRGRVSSHQDVGAAVG